jgi:dipeptidyl aminopeptidase/acylaminoacyl peptidase
MSKGSDTQVTKITNVHKDLTANFVLPKQAAIQWKSYDGYLIEGLITYPINYKKGQLYPLVVQTHGGPRSSDQYGIWSSGSYMPILAAHGYAVLRTNHRGGTGYGDAFLRDMVGKYFRNAHLDVLSGVDHLIKLGIADPNKLVKMGWSAGGHMTNKIITYTNRFKAASTGAGTSDWLSHYGETDTSYNRTAWFGGKPWQKNAPIETYMENSPVKDLWRVKTPTLIFVGGKDVRVPSAQSKILFRGLRDLGVETELYIAPDEPHGFRKLTHRLFKINKELEWFEKHVHGRSYTHQLPPQQGEQE